MLNSVQLKQQNQIQEAQTTPTQHPLLHAIRMMERQ